MSVYLLTYLLTYFPVQNFTDIEQSAAEEWSKTIFNMAAVRYLKFYKFSYFGHVTVTVFQICCCVQNCIEIG